MTVFLSTLAGKVVLLTVSVGVLSVAINHDGITAINTALNFASWWLLLKQQAKLRHEVTPKLDHIEDVATTVLGNRLPGGKRHYDPNAEPDADTKCQP